MHSGKTRWIPTFWRCGSEFGETIALIFYVNASGLQAKSPMKTLDELHICEMPAWPCFPALEERFPYSPKNRTEAELDREDCDQSEGSKSHHNDNCVELKSARPRCYVITARARSFLYHQVCPGITYSDFSRNYLNFRKKPMSQSLCFDYRITTVQFCTRPFTEFY